MDQYSKDGRKLRPRKHVTNSEGPAYSTENKPQRSEGGYNRERSNYGERSSYNRERSNYGSDRGGYNRGGQNRYNNDRSNYGSDRSDRGGYNNDRGSYSRSNGEGYRQNAYSSSYNSDRNNGYNSERSGNGGYHKSSQGHSSNGGYHKSNNGGGYSRPGSRPSGNYQQRPHKSVAPKRKPAQTGFTKESEEGINRMIANSPKANINPATYSSSPIKEEVRLNKFIANSGVCSRREADTMIQAGVVTVNGEVVTELGTKINVVNDVVKFNGETLKGEEKVYLVMNKPKGFVTTASDPHAEKTVMDLIKSCPVRVYPVGRLDKNTTGVLMFTNDGEIAEKLTHPSYDKKKIYQVILNKPLSEEQRQQILAGVELSDGPIAADALEFIDPEDARKLGIEIHSGKNRVVRRIFEAIGLEVRTLDRVYFAGLTKKGLKKGEWRYLTEGEVNILKMGAYV